MEGSARKVDLTSDGDSPVKKFASKTGFTIMESTSISINILSSLYNSLKFRGNFMPPISV